MIAFWYHSILYPLAYFLLMLVKPFVNAKTREMIEDKKKRTFHFAREKSKAEISKQRPFWIHAASGEIEYARPVIRALNLQFPEVPVLVTYSSPSAKKLLPSIEGVAAWGPLPWDRQKDCEQFLDEWKPRCFLIARTDVWPVIAETCKQQRVPSLLFSATFAENSSRLKGVSSVVTEWALNQLTAIHCVSAEDVQALSRIAVRTPISIEGDTRFDQVMHRLQNPKPLKETLRPPLERPVFVAGSTWPEDERQLVPAFAKLQSSAGLIIVPHEIGEEHLHELESLLRNHSLKSQRYSKATRWQIDEVLIVDQIGILAEIYTWGIVAFVGGSFRKQVHSVMEPLAAGLPVFVGPYHHNNREALEFKNHTLCGFAAVSEVKDSNDIVRKFDELMQTGPSQFAKELQSEISKQTKSTTSVLDWCRSH